MRNSLSPIIIYYCPSCFVQGKAPSTFGLKSPYWLFASHSRALALWGKATNNFFLFFFPLERCDSVDEKKYDHFGPGLDLKEII